MSRLLTPLKLDLTLCMFYAFFMMFFPAQITYMYFGKTVDETTLHLCRSWGTTLFALVYGMVMSLSCDEYTHRVIMRIRSMIWLGAFVSSWLHSDLYTTGMYVQTFVMCSFMTGMTLKESGHRPLSFCLGLKNSFAVFQTTGYYGFVW